MNIFIGLNSSIQLIHGEITSLIATGINEFQIINTFVCQDQLEDTAINEFVRWSFSFQKQKLFLIADGNLDEKVLKNLQTKYPFSPIIHIKNYIQKLSKMNQEIEFLNFIYNNIGSRGHKALVKSRAGLYLYKNGFLEDNV